MAKAPQKSRKVNANFVPDQPPEEGPAYSAGPIRSSRPSNKNDEVDPGSLSSLALKYLTIPELKPMVSAVSNIFEMPPGYKTTKSGGWNAKKAVMIGRLLLFIEGREMLLNALKQKNSQINFDSELKNFTFETRVIENVTRPARTRGDFGELLEEVVVAIVDDNPKLKTRPKYYPGNVAPSLELWEELVNAYGDESPDRNPKFDQAWFEYYFKKTNRDPGEEYAEYDELNENTIKELRTATLRDPTNVNGISRTRERLITEILEICGQLETVSLEVALEVLNIKYEEARREAGESGGVVIEEDE